MCMDMKGEYVQSVELCTSFYNMLKMYYWFEYTVILQISLNEYDGWL